MKIVFLILLICIFCEFSLAQNAGGIIRRPTTSNSQGKVDKPSGSRNQVTTYELVSAFCEGLANVMLNGKWGYIDKSGRLVISCKYDFPASFRNGFAVTEYKGKWGYVDKTGKEVIPFKFIEADNFNEGLAPVNLKGKWGLIDKEGGIKWIK